ncbi:T9SS type A sorting domain-containing protein, partial [Sphingobacteriales bacterium CHB3]|nr:T9SS type A sorting domain-containing protein [Sphingobacteriales bacterium CHB3]
STNNGLNWSAVNNGLTNTFVRALLVNGTYLFAGTYGGSVFRSTDNGTSWTPVNAGLTNLTLLALGFDSLGGIYAGTDGGGIFRSTDTGANWTALNNGLTNLSVYAFAASSTDFYAGTDDGVFLYNYNNQSWTQADTGLTNPSIRALAVSGSFLLAGTAGAGVFRALESSLPIVLSHFTATVVTPYHVRLDWGTISEVNNYGFYVERRFGTEVPFAVVPNSFIPGHGTTNEPRWYLFDDTTIPSPGTYQYRLRQVDLDGTPHYTEPIGVITGVTGVGDITPGKFALLQNYPNPFNPSTEIRYQMSEIRHVKLKVFDVLGREVTTLVDEVKQAGKHSVLFDAGNLSSGVYFYRLTAGSNVETKQMMVLK